MPYNSLRDVFEYDFNGTLLRRTQTTYLKNHNGVDYSGSNIQNGSAPHMRDFSLQVSVFDGAGVERARTTFEYDNYLADPPYHAPLEPRSNISGLDPSFTSGFIIRGNVTKTTKYLLTNGVVTGSVSAFALFDVAGNVVKTLDPRGFATTFEFADRFGVPDGEARNNSAPQELSSVGQTSYAFATKVTNAANHIVVLQHDYYLGTAVDSEDPNGILSSNYFNDPLDRPTQVRNAVGTLAQNQTTFSYNDINRIVTTTSDLNTYNDNLLKRQTIYDGLGRATEARQYENSTNFIAQKQIPFVMLQDPDTSAWIRASQSSNNYRPHLGEQPVWTTTFYDSLDRNCKIRTPDNSIVRIGYSANEVTVTDQIAKKRKSVTDALGRLKEIYEDPLGVNYQTSYSYDVLDNLTGVTQGIQTRTFVYDSLKRLSSATNPESGTVSYQYDNNGNLTQKTDARGVISTYAYDALNRNTTIDYSDTSGINPDVTRVYDTATNGKGRLRESYAGGTETAGSNVEHTKIISYDALGRPLDQRQRFKTNSVWSVEFQVQRGFNLAGSVTSQTYPSGRTVTYGYDTAGRLNSFTGNLGDGVNRNYSTEIVYSPLGAIAKEKFGTDTPLYNKSFYNSRGQLSEIRVGTTFNSLTDTGWQRGAIINHYSNQCWGACNGTDNNGNVKKQDHWIPDSNGGVQGLFTQTYTYDDLNRLLRVQEGSWQQEFVYDRWGNRTIHQTNTWGTGINKKDFTVNTANNRLGVPAGQSGVMSYDNAGNLTNDTYTGAGSRAYDAENRMISAWGGNNQLQQYSYNADGQRTRRKIDGIETRQIYGMDGELLAEYAVDAAPAFPQNEYGYRNGQLLVTASNLVGSWKFDENTGTTTVDSAGNGNTGTLTSGAGWGAGQTGSAVSLDGVNDYMQVGAQSSLVMTSAVSFSALIYPTGPGSNATYGGTIVNKEGEYVMARYPNGTIQWGFANSNPGWNFINTGYVAPLNQWTHIAVTYENGTVKTYANGTLVHTFNGSGSIGDVDTAQNDFRLGGRQGISQHFQGRIDEVRVYNRALTASEVSSLPNGALGSPNINWLVADQLGTPRIILDKTGSLASTKLHDYLPFGEELFAGIGGRTTAHGYTSDAIRQKFTGYEHDNETCLDFAQARYYASVQGRFTGVDPISGLPHTSADVEPLQLRR